MAVYAALGRCDGVSAYPEAQLILQVLHKQFSHSYLALVLRTCRRSDR
jgi:hypothetical protein